MLFYLHYESKRGNCHVLCLTPLFTVGEGTLKHGFGAGLAAAGRDVSYPGISATSRAKDPLLPTVSWSEMGAWQQRVSHLQGTVKNLQLHV